MQSRLDDAVAAFDQPSVDGINTYFVSWAARQAGLKVALSGLGSDEIFGGYSTFSSTPRVARMMAPISLAQGRDRSFSRVGPLHVTSRFNSQTRRRVFESGRFPAPIFLHANALPATNRVATSSRQLHGLGRLIVVCLDGRCGRRSRAT